MWFSPWHKRKKNLYFLNENVHNHDWHGRWQDTALALNDTSRVGSVIPMVRNRNQLQVAWPGLSAPQFW